MCRVQPMICVFWREYTAVEHKKIFFFKYFSNASKLKKKNCLTGKNSLDKVEILLEDADY